MKHYFFIVFLLAISFCSNGQPGGNGPQYKNQLLNQSFWKNKPDAAAVKAEVAKGNDPAEQNSMAMDAVVMAINAEAPNESIIYLLEQKGNEVTKLTHDSRTYLFWAAMRGNTEVMEYLLLKGAKINVQDSHGATPLTFAAGTGQQNTVVYDLLLQHGDNIKTDVNSDGANALLLAIGADTSFTLTTYFEQKGLSLKSKDAAGNTAFDYAAKGGNIPAMNILLSKGIKSGGNAMLLAAQGGRRGNSLAVFQYLDSIGIKPTATTKNGENVLHFLVKRAGTINIIQYFIDKGVDVNQADADGNTVCINAASANPDTAAIALLLAHTKNINQKNNTGATALALAVRNNSPQVISYLINNGADIYVIDNKGNNVVYYLFEGYNARQAKDFEPKLSLLQAKGFNINAPQKDGNTLYHLAIAKNDLSLVKLVHNYTVDVNAKNNEGLTALLKAAMVSKDEGIMQYLISIGADKNMKTGFDESAYDLAHENELLAQNKVSIDFLK